MLHLYTRSHGRMQFLVYGRHSRTKKGVILEPMTLLDIEAVLHDNNSLGQMRECSLAYVPKALLLDNSRRCVALFISEILCRTLTHPQQDERLFDFLADTIRELDTCPDPQNVHLRFLVAYAEQLGFAIDFSDPANQYLNSSPKLGEVAHSAGGVCSSATLNTTSRRALLHALLGYYATHIPDFTMPNSLPVLEAVFA